MKTLDDFIGIKYVAGGRDHDGCDCYGLLRLVLLEMFAVSLPEKLTGPQSLGHLWRELDRGADALEALGTIRRTSPVLRPSHPLIVVSRHGGMAIHCGLLFGRSLLHTSSEAKASLLEEMRIYRLKHSVQDYYEWRP